MCRNYGLKLYGDAGILKVPFLIGDVTSDQEFVQKLAADGLFAHIWTGAVLHVLNEAKVEALLRSIFSLLRNGGTYFGTCVGTTGAPSTWHPEYTNRSEAFLHSAKSLEELLKRIGFEEIKVLLVERPDEVRILLFLELGADWLRYFLSGR